ncbi:hypothetical protein PENNAL_c0195G01428 [Penicillium nalgiovense]|uniref:Uncharacterized protein n=1 Tax=Penicillium nalgiovense TaxID=60175 RepID=A0A1V6WSW7_PENNA|nr:hypothetical protein PENNAL_c0195G01428 [Penicillium nalgiovense]
MNCQSLMIRTILWNLQIMSSIWC